jgi:hypothetical protein
VHSLFRQVISRFYHSKSLAHAIFLSSFFMELPALGLVFVRRDGAASSGTVLFTSSLLWQEAGVTPSQEI